MTFFNRKPKPKLAVTPDDKVFIEANYHWLMGQFGSVLDRPVFRPSRLKLKKMRSLESRGEALLAFACRQMEIDVNGIDLTFYDEGQLDRGTSVHISSENGFSLGEYHHKNALTGRFELQLNLQILNNLHQAISTIVHELAHLKLIGEYRIRGDEETHESPPMLRLSLTCPTRRFWETIS